MSDIDYTFTGKLSPDCKSLEIDSASSIARILYPIRDIRLEIHITNFRRQRTLAQNRYCWGVMIPVVQAWQKVNTGECDDKDTIYVYFRKKIIGDKVVVKEVMGEEVIIMEGKKFSQCTTKEFAERVDKIIAYFAPSGCVIPPPTTDSNNYVTDFVDFKYDLTDE